MNHPLAKDLKDLSDDELEKNIQQLTNRFHIARRMGVDEGILNQLDMLLMHYEDERHGRQDSGTETSGVVLETDPLPQEKPDDIDSSPKKFSSVQNIRRRT
ncbi:hypothetical protein UFOVP29_75 [uncultured Caudovirales phage]|uniref:Uncharacterized protein n=1 Tax=uncultured Caudovirales phage TaxID=2100421 RepID=A0A6J5KN82_9CAUD|nr:hypothetical protein UFOVP29_75 [uncultured Caudovirales phage]